MTSYAEFHLSGEGSLQQQVYETIRQAILQGRVKQGDRLPSSRSLAQSLKVSRMTTLLAYERLTIEGYLFAQSGAGTFVAAQVTTKKRPQATATPLELPGFVGKFERLASMAPALPREQAEIDFSHGRIDEGSFPVEDWRKSVREALLQQRYVYPDPMGLKALRQTLQVYLLRRFGLACDWRQIMIVNGSQQGLQLCAQVLASGDGFVGMEEPGYAYASLVFEQAGLRQVSLPVDDEGVQTEVLRNTRKSLDMVYVTPGHQFPLGGVLPMKRRLELLNIASAENFWVLEDDYDSEYRHKGAPLPPLKVLDDNSRVIHLGTFSKTIDPGLRLGYMVLPEELIRPFSLVRILNDQGSATLNQLALASFIQKGRYDRHLRKIRKVLAERRETLIRELARLDDEVSVVGSATGSHIVLWLKKYPFSRSMEIVERIFAKGVYAQPLNYFYANPPEQAGLLIGYGNLTPEEIADGVGRIEAAIRT